MRTMKEVSNDINDNHSDLIFYLYERWQDEKLYEDFNDYVITVKKKIPEIYKGTENHFGFIAKCLDGDLHTVIRLDGDIMILRFLSYKYKTK